MFKVSEKLHVALLLLIELEKIQKTKGFLTVQALAGKYHVSAGYLEEIAGALRKNHIIEGKQGPGGGYRLALSATTLTLAAICSAVEKDLNLVACQNTDHACPAESICHSKHLWKAFSDHINSFLQNTTLADMARQSL